MLFRPTIGADLDRVLACTVTEPISWIPPDRYRAELADRQYRPEWTWIAEDNGQILARALWWGMSDSAHPLALDCVYVHDSVPDRVGLAAALLAAAHDAFRAQGTQKLPEYDLNLPTGWHSDPAVCAAVGGRRAAAARAGLSGDLERLRYEWTSGAGLPDSSGRLTFRPEPDDELFLAALRRIAVGSLDGKTRKNVAAFGADRQAREDMDLYRSMPGEREWWRLAYTADGRLAGLAMPNCNPYGPVVGYLGVVPELRGHRYIDDILAGITRFHAERGAHRITDATDTTNLPMAAAFERAGYRNYDVRLVLSAPAARDARSPEFGGEARALPGSGLAAPAVPQPAGRGEHDAAAEPDVGQVERRAVERDVDPVDHRAVQPAGRAGKAVGQVAGRAPGG